MKDKMQPGRMVRMGDCRLRNWKGIMSALGSSKTKDSAKHCNPWKLLERGLVLTALCHHGISMTGLRD